MDRLPPLSADRTLFDYRAERVAIMGYRCAMAGYDLGDSSCWDALWTCLVEEGGLDFTCEVMGSLQFFVRALRSSREGKCGYYPRNCSRVCEDECLVLSLLSAHQHGASEERGYCLEKLQGEHWQDDAAILPKAAEALARVLSRNGHVLLPVPMAVIHAITQCHTGPFATPQTVN